MIGNAGRVLGTLVMAAILLAVVIWVALGIDLSIELWSDECVFEAFAIFVFWFLGPFMLLAISQQ